MFEDLEEQKRKAGGGRAFTWRGIPYPLKWFIAVALISYGGQLLLTYAPPRHPVPGSHGSFVLAYTVCPVCVLAPTVDPTPSDMAYVIGPINAVIHGVIGAMIGYVIEAFF
jgi:hypothetical protein